MPPRRLQLIARCQPGSRARLLSCRKSLREPVGATAVEPVSAIMSRVEQAPDDRLAAELAALPTDGLQRSGTPARLLTGHRQFDIKRLAIEDVA